MISMIFTIIFDLIGLLLRPIYKGFKLFLSLVFKSIKALVQIICKVVLLPFDLFGNVINQGGA